MKCKWDKKDINCIIKIWFKRFVSFVIKKNCEKLHFVIITMQTKNTYISYSSKICRNEALNCQPYRLTCIQYCKPNKNT